MRRILWEYYENIMFTVNPHARYTRAQRPTRWAQHNFRKLCSTGRPIVHDGVSSQESSATFRQNVVIAGSATWVSTSITYLGGRRLLLVATAATQFLDTHMQFQHDKLGNARTAYFILCSAIEGLDSKVNCALAWQNVVWILLVFFFPLPRWTCPT